MDKNVLVKVVFLYVLAVFAGLVSATDYTWVGESNTLGSAETDYLVGVNWDPNTFPTYSKSTGLILNNGYTSETVNSGGTLGGGKVDIGGGSTLVVNHDAYSTGGYFLAGGSGEPGTVIGNGGTGTLDLRDGGIFSNIYGNMALGGYNNVYGTAGYGIINISGPACTGLGTEDGTCLSLEGTWGSFMIGGYDGGDATINQTGGTIQSLGRSINMAYRPNAIGGKVEWLMSGGNAFGIDLLEAGRSTESDVDIHLSNDAYIQGGTWHMGMQWLSGLSYVDITQSDTSEIELSGSLILAERTTSVVNYSIADSSILTVSDLIVGNSGGNDYDDNGNATFEVIGGDAAIVAGSYQQNGNSTLKALIDQTTGVSKIEVVGDATFAAGAQLDVSLLGGGSLASTSSYDILEAANIIDNGLVAAGDYSCCWSFSIVDTGSTDILRVTYEGDCSGCTLEYTSSETQWDFNGDLTATSGPAFMEYIDGSGGATETQTAFGIPSDFGIADAELETISSLMLWPDGIEPMGYRVIHNSAPTPGYTDLLTYSIMFDVYCDGVSNLDAGNLRIALSEDLYIWLRPAGAADNIPVDDILAGGSSYPVSLDQWHRFVVTYDATVSADTQTELKVYIDGHLVGSQIMSEGGDGSFYALSASYGSSFNVFTSDQDSFSGTGFVSALNFYNYVLDQTDVENMGGLSSFCTEPVAGDLNDDCQVDFVDFTMLAGSWLDCNLDPISACN